MIRDRKHVASRPSAWKPLAGGGVVEGASGFEDSLTAYSG